MRSVTQQIRCIIQITYIVHPDFEEWGGSIQYELISDVCKIKWEKRAAETVPR